MTVDPIEVLTKLVSFDTRNEGLDKKSGKECPVYINNILENYGFQTELLESEGYYTAFGRRGQGAFKILFLAHFDIVPFGEGWKTDPLTLKVDGDIAYGRGTCDDKGNIVSLLMLASLLAGSDIPCMTMIAASGDEEIGGSHGAKVLKDWLMKNGMFPDYIVVADGLHQQIIHRRRNILPTFIKAKEKISNIKGYQETVRFTTDTFGSDTRHSAYLRPGVDRHAMLAASKYLDLNPEVMVTQIRGSFVKSNVVPDWVEMDIIHPDSKGLDTIYDETLTNIMRLLLSLSQAAFPTKHSDKGKIVSPNLLSKEDNLWTLYCDIRAMTNDDEAVKKAIEDAINGNIDLFSLKVVGGAGYVESNPNSRLIRAMKWALEKEGVDYRLIEGFGGSDSRYFAGQGSDLFDFGPEGDNLHGANEWVSLSSLKQNAEVFHRLLEILTREKSPV
ncbi:M20/M25/M40 family metallo-hydrolase [Candidatus Thorarchaeota archaeon]|nr:MAG: M20/M25/M40 family metallo-hydrolase [Candidatus Thorarchaeota archaeon]